MSSNTVLRFGAACVVAAVVAAVLVATRSPAQAASPSGYFIPETPVRLLDTRTPAGGNTPLGPGAVRTLNVTAAGSPIQAGEAVAVALSVTVASPTSGGWLTISPAGEPRPLASSINFDAGETISNAIVAAVGDGDSIDIFSPAGQVHVVMDLLGWYTETPAAGSGRFVSMPPERVADTRTTTKIPGRQALVFTLADAEPVSDVTAAAVNVVATQPEGWGWLTLTPWDVPVPLVSNVAYGPGETRAAGALVGVGSGRQVGLFNGGRGPVHQVVDLNGVFVDPAAVTGGEFMPLAPERVYDSRRPGQAPLAPSEVRTVDVGGPAGEAEVAAVVANVTVVQPSRSTWVATWPGGSPWPGVSNLNVDAGDVVANLVTVGVDGDGRINVMNAKGNAHVIIDVVGYYAPWADAGGS